MGEDSLWKRILNEIVSVVVRGEGRRTKYCYQSTSCCEEVVGDLAVVVFPLHWIAAGLLWKQDSQIKIPIKGAAINLKSSCLMSIMCFQYPCVSSGLFLFFTSNLTRSQNYRAQRRSLNTKMVKKVMEIGKKRAGNSGGEMIDAGRENV